VPLVPISVSIAPMRIWVIATSRTRRAIPRSHRSGLRNFFEIGEGCPSDHVHLGKTPMAKRLLLFLGVIVLTEEQAFSGK
jgi:hypothetical protein